jgi:hypothetical protein
MMNKIIAKFLSIADELNSDGNNLNQIITQLKMSGATYAITVVTLEKMGYDLDNIEEIIEKSKVWKGFERSFEDLFFDFVELQDDANDTED